MLFAQVSKAISHITEQENNHIPFFQHTLVNSMFIQRKINKVINGLTIYLYTIHIGVNRFIKLCLHRDHLPLNLYYVHVHVYTGIHEA